MYVCFNLRIKISEIFNHDKNLCNNDEFNLNQKMSEARWNFYHGNKLAVVKRKYYAIASL